VADVVEAILGAAYLSVGFPGVYIAAQSFEIPVLEYDATLGKKMFPEPPTQVSHLLRPNDLQTLEEIIGHTFKKPFYLAQVFVSRSIPMFMTFQYLTPWLDRQTERGLSTKAQGASDWVSSVMEYWISVSSVSSNPWRCVIFML